MSSHYWSVCPMCGPMVCCGTCDNNACNAGYGTLPDGTTCLDCESAYELQSKGPTELKWKLIERWWLVKAYAWAYIGRPAWKAWDTLGWKTWQQTEWHRKWRTARRKRQYQKDMQNAEARSSQR